MADVRKYTEQIARAKKGKDVRAAIVSAINEVSDENNTYNQTKADIQAAQKSINADVTKNQQIQQAFSSNLQEVKEVQKDLAAKMNTGTTLTENLEKKNATATSLDKSLGEKNTAATKTVQTLEADITAANTAAQTLEADTTAANKAAQTLKTNTTAAGKAEQSLEADITAAGQAERNLEADVTAAGEAKTKLDASIKTSGENIATMQNLVQNADQIKTGLETDLNNAQQASKDLKENTAASVTKIETAGQTQIDLIKQNGGGVENALSNYFALRRNGKVFTTKIYKWETSTSPVGVKMNANENMVAEPSVGRKEGRDDYAQYGLFHHFTCNFSVDENGFNHVDCLEGQIGFSKTGKVQVGEVTMSAWFGIEDTADAVLYHYSDSQTELTPYPMKESINPDGTLSPFMIHAKYAAGDIGGVPYSSKGLAPANGCQATEATMPWHSGATDEVAGSDGSPNSNTNGKDPYKIQGIETCIGAYEVLGNVVMDIVTGPDGNPARDVYVCEDASTLSSNIATVRANYKKAISQAAYTAASWKYITQETTDPNLGIMIPTKVGGGSTTGFADGLYTDAGTSGQREWFALGGLSAGVNAGLWFLGASGGWSGADWPIVSGVSPNGTRGEWQATA